MVSPPLPNDIKLVWVASMPRSGSMWAYNVSRSVLHRAGRQVFPATVPKAEPDMMTAARQGLDDRDPGKIWALKVHQFIGRATPRSRFIATHRDPRDALVSFRRFMGCDFESALTAMAGSTRACDHYRAFPAVLCLNLDYEDILARPRETVQRIADHIGCPVPAEIAAEIVAEFSKAKVRQRIRETEARLQRRAAQGDRVGAAEFVRVGPDNLRAFDLTTGFQSNHVSDYQEGNWRVALTPAEQDRLHAVLGPWLGRHGYLDSGPSS